MKNEEFNSKKRTLNAVYYEEFGEIPCIQKFLCTREEYIDALSKAVEHHIKIEQLLKPCGSPQNKNLWT